MALSLFIMLLAFFIVLNAISSFVEHKSHPIVQSIQETFSTKIITPDVAPAIIPDDARAFREGDTIERIDALFKSQITSYDAVKDTGRGIMQVELPLNVFTTAVMAIGQEDILKTSPDVQVKGRKFFLPTLVSLMKSDTEGLPYRMDMVLHVPENPAQLQNRDPKKLGGVMAQGARLADQLQKNGLAEKLVSVGVARGNPGKIDLVFRPHKPFTPYNPAKQGGADVGTP